jgi:hypothetical protein
MRFDLLLAFLPIAAGAAIAYLLERGAPMAKRKLPPALKAHQFKKGTRKPKAAGRTGGMKSPKK